MEITSHMHGRRYVWPFSFKSGLVSCIFNLKCSGVYFQRRGAFTLSADCLEKSNLSVYLGVHLITEIGNASVSIS